MTIDVTDLGRPPESRPTTPAPVRLAVLGAGRIAAAYGEAFTSTSLAQPGLVADIAEPVAAELAENLSVPACTADELLADLEAVAATGIDAVLVATPPNTHTAIVNRLVAAGIPVLCEKPFALSPDAARSMVKAARAAGVLMTVASKFRYHAPLRRALTLVADGVIGELREFECCFASQVDMAGRWNSDPSVSGGGVIADNGPHAFDLARLCAGPLASVRTFAARDQSLSVESDAQICFRSDSGVLGSVTLSWTHPSPTDAFVSLIGTHGRLDVGWHSMTLRSDAFDDDLLVGPGYDKVACLAGQLDNFAGALRGYEALAVTPDDAVASTLAIDAAYRSLTDHAWTRLAD